MYMESSVIVKITSGIFLILSGWAKQYWEFHHVYILSWGKSTQAK